MKFKLKDFEINKDEMGVLFNQILSIAVKSDSERVFSILNSFGVDYEATND